jgi:hypothetical protein
MDDPRYAQSGTQHLDAPAPDPSTRSGPLMLRKYRVYTAKLETSDNPFTEAYVGAFLTNMGFDNLTIKGEGADMIVTGRYMGADNAPIPVDKRLVVTEA